MAMIEVFENVVPASTCQGLIDVAESLIAASAARGNRRSPVSYSFRGDFGEPAQRLALAALQACIERISAPSFEEGAEKLFVETINVTTTFPGERISLHADNCELDGSGHWVPSKYRQRCLSAILYLNQEFDGGELVFEAQQMEIKPRTGLLVVFPSGHEHQHRVNVVGSSKRYALAIWFTTHRWHALLPDSIPVRWPR